MVKLEIKYETTEEKDKLIKILTEGFRGLKISKEYKQGKYYRIYVDVE